MTEALVIGPVTVPIPVMDDTSNLNVLAMLLAEYRRVTKTQLPPQGAFQHLVLLRLELEYEGYVEEHAHDRVSETGKTVFTAWTDKELSIADEFYMNYVNDVCHQLMDICSERVTNRNRIERRHKTHLEDLIMARMMAVLNDALDDFEYYLDREIDEALSI